MTANTAITQRVIDAMVPGLSYYYRDLRGMGCLRGIEDQQLRNALVSLQTNGRLLKTGSHAHYRYYINPTPPLMRADAARSTMRALADTRAGHASAPVQPAIAPTWPVFDHALLRRNPIPRIAA